MEPCPKDLLLTGRVVSGTHRTRPALCFASVSGPSHRGYDAIGMAQSPGGTSETKAGAMRTMSRTGLVGAGLGLAAVGGFFGSLLRERSALTAARVAAGEGSEEQPSWGAGSYRSRWTIFRIFPSAVARVSSGNWTPSAAKPR
ncbi:hypothetical protein SAM23877_3770 [Streptomyces ambofaciens ATCC 23877]|uniref:Uncharacterized protein n=1 Tax=Streptomyces ambofaciens (strain ATCC 23877 / 3486 / DSM 40053 / JCM 4204 / NBRC 12836 / NRRL B-2516) TaxID=278992 RepID=A0A0K2AUK2_STRA7|nr:hypothetical protein SAM23877_3770 [Streptomyces ambofaciens ATCC 23877]